MKIVLFLTYGSSLASWEKDGILDRELELYKEHARMGADIHIISYGGPDDLEIARQYNFFQVHCNDKRLHPRLYAWLLPILHANLLKTADIYKTNQMFGAHIALRCKSLWKVPTIIRQGYGYYEHRAEEASAESPSAQKALKYEKSALSKGDLCIFTTPELAERAYKRHELSADKFHVVPNYIVPETWSPPYQVGSSETNDKFVFYGRFTEQKNLHNLIEAVATVDARLTLIGNGPLKQSLQSHTQFHKCQCHFINRMSQAELKGVLQEHDAFVLPSLYEGHPKALLEVLAFGMPVLAANSPGISEQITDGSTALLTQTDTASLIAGLKKMMSLSKEQREAMSAAARQDSLDKYSVAAVAKNEQSLWASLAKGKKS